MTRKEQIEKQQLVEKAMKEVEAKAKAFTEAHAGESAEEILAEMRGEEPALEKAAEQYATNVDFDGNKTLIGNEADAFKAGANWQRQRDGIPVSNDLEKSAREYSFNIPSEIFNDLSPVLQNIWKHEIEAAFKNGVLWQEQKDAIPVTKDLKKLIGKLSEQFPEVSFAKLSRIAVRVSRWQKEQDK